MSHIVTLAKFLNNALSPYEISLSSVTVSLVDAMIAILYRAPRDAEQLLSEMKNYIECYISDEDLSPKAVAAAFEISARHAHKLFERDGCTIGEWVLSRRLERSAINSSIESTLRAVEIDPAARRFAKPNRPRFSSNLQS